MSRGRIYRSNLRGPRGRRRARRLGNGSRAPHGHGVPLSLVRPRKKTGQSPLSLFIKVFAGLLLSSVIVLIALTGTVAAAGFMGWDYVTSDLPAESDMESLQFETTKIYDRNWKLLTEVSDPRTGWRTTVTYGEIVDNVELQKDDPNKPGRAWIFDATVAAEDATFWTNPGVDPAALLRAVIINFSGSGSSGASTITQQLVRTVYPESIGTERSYSRKLREAIMALRFNRTYPKEKILEMYLNNTYYGNRSYGIDAAAQAYFNKHAWDLSLAEAAMLAGLPQAPSLYDPTQNYELAKARQQYVLEQMVKQGMITEQQAQDAYAEPLSPQSRDGRYNLAPHFTNYVKYYLEQKFGADVLYRDGLIVRTTLDYETQVMAQETVSNHIKRLAPWDVNNGALVAMLPWSGEIIAMVGSADYYNEAIDGQVNVAVRERQPGSSIKPFTYLAAFEKGWHPGTIIFDYNKRWPTPGAPQPFYEPLNASRQSYGAISVREALANSLNVPAVQALEYVGVENMIDLAHKMGIRTGLWRGTGFYGLAITLGGGEVALLEHTNAFGTLANNGRYVASTPIMEVVDKNGNVLYQLDRNTVFEKGEQVVKPEHAYQITHILSDDVARTMIWGRNGPMVLRELNNRPAAVKTGTTEDARDGWTMGYTTDLVVGVWAGNTDNHPTRSLDGIAGAGMIWHEFMVKVHQDPQHAQVLVGPNGQPIPEEFVRPPNIIEAPVCTATGKKPIPGVQTRTEVLVKGEGPELLCNQMNDYERKELEAALKTTSRMNARGNSTLNAYALAVGVRSAEPTPDPRGTPRPSNSNGQPSNTGAPTPTPRSGPSQNQQNQQNQSAPQTQQPAPQPTPPQQQQQPPPQRQN